MTGVPMYDQWSNSRRGGVLGKSAEAQSEFSAPALVPHVTTGAAVGPFSKSRERTPASHAPFAPPPWMQMQGFHDPLFAGAILPAGSDRIHCGSLVQITVRPVTRGGAPLCYSGCDRRVGSFFRSILLNLITHTVV